MILISETRNKLNAPEETLKYLTINNAGYYESDSANANGKGCDPASDLKLDTNTSDGKKRKATETSKGYLQQKLLSNQNLPIINTTIDPRIDNMVATYGASLLKVTTPQTTKVITDMVRSST